MGQALWLFKLTNILYLTRQEYEEAAMQLASLSLAYTHPAYISNSDPVNAVFLFLNNSNLTAVILRQ